MLKNRQTAYWPKSRTKHYENHNLELVRRLQVQRPAHFFDAGFLCLQDNVS